MNEDPKQYTNLAEDPAHAETVSQFRTRMNQRLAEVRTNDLGIDY